MARASIKTLLPLDRFAAIVGMNPLHFNGVEDQTLAPGGKQELAPHNTCDDLLVQYPYQAADCVAREEIARAIADAETQITSWLGYSPAPAWVVDERVMLTRPFNPTFLNYSGRDVRNFWQQVKLGQGYVISGGVEAWSLIQSGVVVVYTDVDGDGYDEVATMAVPTSITDANEISVHYPGKVAAGDYTYEVRPITVRIAAGTATITCRREQLVGVEFIDRLVVGTADGQDNNDFLATVDVYRHYNDASQQAHLLWLQSWCNCSNAGCSQCEGVSQTACLMPTDERNGLVTPQPGTWDGTSVFTSSYLSECRMADKMRVWYRAGWRNQSLPMPNVQMDPDWERAVAYFALGLLDRPLCLCENLRAYTAYWTEDLASASSSAAGSMTTRVSNMLLDNPLGTTRGAIFAWRRISQNRVGEAVSNA